MIGPYDRIVRNDDLLLNFLAASWANGFRPRTDEELLRRVRECVTLIIAKDELIFALGRLYGKDLTSHPNATNRTWRMVALRAVVKERAIA